MELKSLIEKGHIPEHIAIIMDGNGRWAKRHGRTRIFGHNNGVKAVREASEGCAELGVKYLTLFAFSTENWNRPRTEVDALMGLLVKTLQAEVKTLNKNKIRLQAIGNLENLPKSCRKGLQKTIDQTAANTTMTLTLALSYSAKWEITEAVKKIAVQVQEGTIQPQNINEGMIRNQFASAFLPDPELLIRTSGENRISNFLLWQIAYTELYFTPCLWPDFNKQELYRAIHDFQQRERRFGMISEQLASG